MENVSETTKQRGGGYRRTKRIEAMRGEEKSVVKKSFTMIVWKGELSKTDSSILFLLGQTKQKHFL